MLYLFAGESRKADVRHYLEEFCDLAQVCLEISEMDICRDPSMDLLNEAIAKRALQQIRDGSWDVVIVTPPCNTFSRVRFVQPGPKPVRSRLYPLGFPWLSDLPGKEISSSISPFRCAVRMYSKHGVPK